MKNIIRIFIFWMVVYPVFADWKECYFRGTPNSWKTTPMEKVGLNLWKININFTEGDDNGGPRFKIARDEEWRESYPVSDYEVEKYGEYEIIFNDKSKKIEVRMIRELHKNEIKTNWKESYFRGTPNDWSCDKMEKTGNNLWSKVVEFDTKKDKNMKFKISKYQNWEEAYPLNDYIITVSGKYEIIFNDETRKIYVQKLSEGSWENCYFRGTPNSWQTTPMKKIDENLWSLIVKFGDGDNSGGPRFKISRYQNWEESYPASDCSVEKNSSYEIIFQSEIKAIYLKKLD